MFCKWSRIAIETYWDFGARKVIPSYLHSAGMLGSGRALKFPQISSNADGLTRHDKTTMWLEDTLTYFNMKILMWRCPEGQCSALAPARGRTLGRPSLGRDHPWKCWDVLRQNYLQLSALEKTLMDDLTRGLARPKPQVQATKKIYAECDANLLVHAVIVEPTSDSTIFLDFSKYQSRMKMQFERLQGVF